MKKKRIHTCIFVFTFAAFLLLMDYPYLSRLYNDRISGEVAASCQKNEDGSDCETRLEQAREYNRYLAGDSVSLKEQSGWEKGWMEAAKVLCLEESDLAGWIRIPALDLILPLYIGTKDESLNHGAGILEGSSLPVGGCDTHSCISAHRGLPDRTLFTNLDLLHNKDRIEVHTLAQTLFYEVFGNETVKPSDTRPLAIQPGKDLLTLITCTPYGINSHRLYVHAVRCMDPYAQGGEEEAAISFVRRLMNPVFWKLWWWVPATVLLLLFLILLVRNSYR